MTGPGILRRAALAAADAAGRGVVFATSAVLWLFLIAFSGLGLLVYGVGLVSGRGAACIVAGIILLAIAGVVFRGLSNGG